MSVRSLLAILTVVFASSAAAQPAQMSDLNNENLQEVEERLAETIAADLRLLRVWGSPNFPFDFSVFATYAVTSKIRGRGVCQTETVNFICNQREFSATIHRDHMKMLLAIWRPRAFA